MDSIDSVVKELAETSEPEDIVLTLGAGNVWNAGEKLLRLLKHE
jgi:UDP-N-acetylmuramate-alanine ligase